MTHKKTVTLNENNSLTCPSCGSTTLSATRVTTYKPDEGEVASISRTGNVGDRILENNPSEGQNSIAISFNCSTCVKVGHRLVISDDRGSTKVDWRPKH